MGRGITFAQIKKALPDIDKTERSAEMEALGERVDKVEAIEKFLQGEDGQKFRDHFVAEIAETLGVLFSVVDDHSKVIPVVSRLQVLVSFVRMMSSAESEAEAMREIVFEMIDEIDSEIYPK